MKGDVLNSNVYKLAPRLLPSCYNYPDTGGEAVGRGREHHIRGGGRHDDPIEFTE